MAAGGEVLLTVPLIGWTPLDRSIRWGFSVAKYGAQQQTECSYSGYPSWCRPDAGNGVKGDGTDVTGNDPHDTSVEIGPGFVTGWLSHLAGRVGWAAQGGVRYVALDNEPMLWNSTHRDVHPAPVTYDEIWSLTENYALAIKSLDPDIRILGPVVWGWCAYFYSASDGCFPGPDRAAHGNMDFLPWYLKQVHDYELSRGVRLVDYLDVHFYPQADGVYQGGESAAEVRLRSLKSLYDPSYTDESWIGQPVNLIPRMKGWIDQYAPGLGLAITEYSWGPDDQPSAALAQAESLAIFGREGVDLATRWVAPEEGSLTEDAFRLFLDYDGAGAKVDGDSVFASSGDVDRLGAYAVHGADGRLFLLLFNKSQSPLSARVTLAGATLQPAALFRFDASNRLGPAGTATPADGRLDLDLPARSATLAVLSGVAWEGRYGDLNLDGTVDAQDHLLLAGWLSGALPAGAPPFGASPALADLDGSGSVAVADLVILACYLAGEIDALPL